jgi:cupin fold WbuC family metalloprotein
MFDPVGASTGTFRYLSDGQSFGIDYRKIAAFLKDQARSSGLTQARVCFHEADQSALQCMLVYHSTAHVVARHCHISKDEYITIIEGCLSIELYSSENHLTKTVTLSLDADDPRSVVTCKIIRNTIHSVAVVRDAVFLETTSGPFVRNETIKIS